MAGKETDLRRLGDAQDDAGVLDGEESLGHEDVQRRW